MPSGEDATPRASRSSVANHVERHAVLQGQAAHHSGIFRASVAVTSGFAVREEDLRKPAVGKAADRRRVSSCKARHIVVRDRPSRFSRPLGRANVMLRALQEASSSSIATSAYEELIKIVTPVLRGDRNQAIDNFA